MRKLLVLQMASILFMSLAIHAAEKEADDDASKFKFKASGWGFIENETLENFGDGVAHNFDSKDPNNSLNDTNLLMNLKFEAEKDNLKFESILEVGEVFFGDDQTGGNQGLRGKNIEVRHLNVEEKYGQNWYFKAGLFWMNADPRGFVFSDGLTGATIRHETSSTTTQLWSGSASAPTPANHPVVRDTYTGITHNYRFNEDTQLTGFITYRGTRESFTDKDLVTTVTGDSKYYWAGLNYDQKNIPGHGHVEANLIASQSNFKADNGGNTDTNSSWLGHARIDYEVAHDWTLGLDALGTGGGKVGLVNGQQVLGEKKGFASPAPSSAYLLTIATSDSADDAAGSTRYTKANQIARLDTNEGLQMGVVSLRGVFNDKWDGLVRYGQIKTAQKSALTNSDDYGSEVDLRLRFLASANTSWIFEGGIFDPGSYFANQDNAKLISVMYRLEF